MRRRCGVAITYSTIARGATPYSKKVSTAPTTVPWGLVPSAAAIIKATYTHAIVTRYMPYPEIENYNMKNSVIMG